MAVFDFLVRAVEEPASARLEVANVIQVLISAEFLGMDELVEKSLAFMVKNLGDVIKLPIDMSCIN